MAYIGSKPADKPVVASDLDPTIITGQTALATAPADTDEFIISDAGVLKRIDASLVIPSVANTPAFHARRTSSQSIPNTTDTIMIFDTEQFDTDSAYNTASGTFTVPSEEGGKYCVYVGLRRSNWQSNRFVYNLFRADDSAYAGGDLTVTGVYSGGYASNVIILSAGDTVRVGVYHDNGSAQSIKGAGSGTDETFFGAYKLII